VIFLVKYSVTYLPLSNRRRSPRVEAR